MSNLGDRMKRYESAFNSHLVPRSPVIIRVDGKCFHSYMRGVPIFHPLFLTSIRCSAENTLVKMQGGKIAYHQSDEVSFLLTDYDSLESEGWFAYELNKLVSLTASIFTANFNYYFCKEHTKLSRFDFAYFDCRAFNVPEEDVPNYFLWRQRDWERNSVMMFAGEYFSHKQLDHKKVVDVKEMLLNSGQDWEQLENVVKYGTWIQNTRNPKKYSAKLTYETIKTLIQEVKNE